MTPVEERLLPSAEPVRLIDQDGVPHANPSYPLPTKEALVDGYVQLIKGRRINDQACALVRQGRLAVYPSSHGQEACQVAAAQVLARAATGCSRPTATPSRSSAAASTRSRR